MDALKLHFRRKKETKNKIVFEEYAEGDGDFAGEQNSAAVGSLYVSRLAVKQLGDPEQLTVTIDVGER